MTSPILLLQNGVAYPAPPPALPAATFHAIAVNSGQTGQASATFSVAPAVGDWLIAVQTYVTATSPATGWTAQYGGAACGSYGAALAVVYHQVQAGEAGTTTWTPFSANTSPVWAIAIADVTSGLSSWGALYQNLYANCVSSNAANTISGFGGAGNSTVLAVGVPNIATSGSILGVPTITGITGNSNASYFNAGGGAGVSIVAADQTLPTLGEAATATITPNMSGGFAGNVAVLIFLNPG